MLQRELSKQSPLGRDTQRATTLLERGRTLHNKVCRVGQEKVRTLHIYLAHHLLRGVEITHKRLSYEGHLRKVNLGHRLLRP